MKRRSFFAACVGLLVGTRLGLARQRTEMDELFDKFDSTLTWHMQRKLGAGFDLYRCYRSGRGGVYYDICLLRQRRLGMYCHVKWVDGEHYGAAVDFDASTPLMNEETLKELVRRFQAKYGR